MLILRGYDSVFKLLVLVSPNLCPLSTPDFSNNRFDKVPKEIIGFKALVKLNCHHNSIRWMIEELYLLTNLKDVDMR